MLDMVATWCSFDAIFSERERKEMLYPEAGFSQSTRLHVMINECHSFVGREQGVSLFAARRFSLCLLVVKLYTVAKFKEKRRVAMTRIRELFVRW